MTKDVNLMPSDAAIAAPKKKRKKIASLEKRKSRSGWLFVLPFILGFLLVYLPMIYDSFIMTFHEIGYDQVKINGKTESIPTLTWVGFENYIDAFTKDNSNFLTNLLAGLQDLALDVPSILIFSLFMAILLNQKMAGRAVFRAIFFIPVVLATGAMETFFKEDQAALDSVDTGAGTGSAADASGGGGAASSESGSNDIVNTDDFAALFANFNVGKEFIEFITGLVRDIYNLVNRSGVQMLIFLAGLQSVSPAIYESCKIDGASAWETFWKITLPILSPMILVNAIYTIIDAFTSESNVVMSYISKVSSNSTNINVRTSEVATAMAWVYFLVVALIVAAIAGIFSAFVFYQRKSE